MGKAWRRKEMVGQRSDEIPLRIGYKNVLSPQLTAEDEESRDYKEREERAFAKVSEEGIQSV